LTGASHQQDPPSSTDLLIRLLEQLRSLLHPPILASEQPTIMLVLSDLYGLFSIPRQGGAAKKLVFYVEALRELRREDWLRLENEVRKEVDKLRSENVKEKESDDRPAVKIS